jgi:protease-4
MNSFCLRRASLAGVLMLAGLAADLPARAAPPRASEPVPDPGKGVTNADDTAAIAQNPANLAFLPGPEVRWNLVWTGPSTTVPVRGTSFAAGLPVGSI